MNMNFKKLVKLAKENPALEVIAMVDEEIVADYGYSRWMASFGESRIDYIYHKDEKIYIKSLDTDELEEEIRDCIYNSLWLEDEDITDEQLEELTQEEMNRISWEKVILINIDTP